jgi:hypothetical protein
MLLGAVLAGVVALLVVLGAACLATPAAPAPEAPFSLEDQPRPTTAQLQSPGQTEPVQVVGAGTEGVNLRAEPGTTGARLKGLVDGTELEVIGPDRTVAGRTWRNVRDPSDRSEGWVAAEFLASP